MGTDVLTVLNSINATLAAYKIRLDDLEESFKSMEKFLETQKIKIDILKLDDKEQKSKIKNLKSEIKEIKEEVSIFFSADKEE